MNMAIESQQHSLSSIYKKSSHYGYYPSDVELTEQTDSFTVPNAGFQETESEHSVVPSSATNSPSIQPEEKQEEVFIDIMNSSSSEDLLSSSPALLSLLAGVGSPKGINSKRKRRTKKNEDNVLPMWADLALRYLQYAKRSAIESDVDVDLVKQLPSITHMIAVPFNDGDDDIVWRWCDAYHAIKYLKDEGFVTTSRGAKGTSIKDGTTIPDIISAISDRFGRAEDDTIESFTYNVPIKKRKVHHAKKTIHKNMHVLFDDEKFSFILNIVDLRNINDLEHAVEKYLRDQSLLDVDVVLVGYVENSHISKDYIHANSFTSIHEIVQDARDIHFSAFDK